MILFGLYSLLYIIKLAADWKGSEYPLLQKLVTKSEKIRGGWLMFVAALIGLWMVSITGALGGAIAYGPNIDPFVSIVYHWLIK